jgi:hypothetical protein
MGTRPDQQNQPLPTRILLLLVAPLLVALVVAAFSGGEEPAAPDLGAVETAEVDGRLIVILVDSLRPRALDDDLMPSLRALSERPETTRLALRSCKANFSLPCIQTMMEGRRSPFVAGLHNFTGRAGSEASLPGLLDEVGYGVAMISDHTLDSLYGEHAVASLDVQEWADSSHLERDLKAIERAEELLDDPELDALLLHLVGTDKSAHHDQPGTDAYREHFRSVDAALDDFLPALDLERDAVLIVGDHGHDALGHHTRESVALFAGAPYEQLFAQLDDLEEVEQVDLLYFMTYPMLVPVHRHYEGAIYAADAPQGRLAHFQQVQRAQMTHAGVSEDVGLVEGLAELREQQADSRFDPVKGYAPLLLLFALFVANALRLVARGAEDGDAWLLGGLLLAALPIAALTSPALGLWLALPILVGGGWLAWRRGAVREHLFVGLVVALAALTGAFAAQWSELFHSTGGFLVEAVYFYLVVFAAGALCTLALYGRLERLHIGMMAAGFFCLPSGVYYYQFGQNMFFGGFIGALLVGAWWLLRGERRQKLDLAALGAKGWLVAAVTLGAAVLLSLPHAAGWKWNLWAIKWLEPMAPALTWSFFVLFALFWAWRARTTIARAVILAFCLGAAVYCVGLAELGTEQFITAFLPTLFLVGLLDIGRRQWRLDAPSAGTPTPLGGGLFVLALATFAVWTVATGFLLQNVDFSFGLDWFGELFARERDVFAATYVATLLKYGLPSMAVVLALYTGADRKTFHAVAAGAGAFISLKVLTLLVQVFAGSAVQSEKYHELAISDLLFFYALSLALVVAYVGVRVWERVRGPC